MVAIAAASSGVTSTPAASRTATTMVARAPPIPAAATLATGFLVGVGSVMDSRLRGNLGGMDNNDVLVLYGFGLACAGLALLVPVAGARPAWVVPLLGVVAAVLGLLGAL